MQTKFKTGFTLIETLFYTAGLLVLFAAMSGFLYYMYDWYQKATLAPRVDRIGTNVVDTITKDIRSGVSVSAGTFNSNNGSLTLSAKVNSVAVTRYLALSNGRLVYQENGGTTSYLTPEDLTVSKFYLVSTSTDVSQGITFDINIDFASRTGTTTQSYSGFAMLRQSN